MCNDVKNPVNSITANSHKDKITFIKKYFTGFRVLISKYKNISKYKLKKTTAQTLNISTLYHQNNNMRKTFIIWKKTALSGLLNYFEIKVATTVAAIAKTTNAIPQITVSFFANTSAFLASFLER